MLIGHSIPNYILIRCVIISIRLVAPVSVAYCLYLLLFLPADKPRLPLPLEIYLAAEATFLLLAYLPLRLWLQGAAPHPPPPCRADREVLFRKCLDSVDDVDGYLSGWFLNSPLVDIKRENVKEFYAWSFLSKSYFDVSAEEMAELDRYADQLDQQLRVKLEPGRGKATSLRTTLDDALMQHRPLMWYLVRGLPRKPHYDSCEKLR